MMHHHLPVTTGKYDQRIWMILKETVSERKRKKQIYEVDLELIRPIPK